MTPKQIQYFESVCKNQSITKAAEECFVSRPVISRALSGLEKELGVALFERTENHKLILTESGKACRIFFREYNSAFSTMLERLHTTEPTKSSRILRVGITPTIGKRLYPGFLSDFRKAYTDAQIVIQEVSALKSQDSVIGGDIDVFFSPASLDKTTVLESLWLYDSEFVFCVSSSSEYAGLEKIHMDEIGDLPMATLFSPASPRLQMTNVFLTTSQQDLMRTSVACGDAYAVLPLDVVADWSDIATVPLDPGMVYSVHMIWNKALPHGSVFEDLLIFAKNYSFKEND